MVEFEAYAVQCHACKRRVKAYREIEGVNFCLECAEHAPRTRVTGD